MDNDDDDVIVDDDDDDIYDMISRVVSLDCLCLLRITYK